MLDKILRIKVSVERKGNSETEGQSAFASWWSLENEAAEKKLLSLWRSDEIARTPLFAAYYRARTIDVLRLTCRGDER